MSAFRNFEAAKERLQAAQEKGIPVVRDEGFGQKIRISSHVKESEKGSELLLGAFAAYAEKKESRSLCNLRSKRQKE